MYRLGCSCLYGDHPPLFEVSVEFSRHDGGDQGVDDQGWLLNGDDHDAALPYVDQCPSLTVDCPYSLPHIPLL